MLSLLAIAGGFALELTPAPAPEVPPADLEAFVRDTAKCPGDRKYCFGIALHVVVAGGKPVQDPAWVDRQLERAAHHFDLIDAAFEIVSADALPSKHWLIHTRRDRDRVGRKRFTEGVVHWFVVGQLDDVDVPGEFIRGVHWRQRSEITRRWIIMARYAKPTVLAHELGHFFDLPHSRYAVSIMNKRRRETPPFEKRAFAPEEVPVMREALQRMLDEGMLEKRRRRRKKK